VYKTAYRFVPSEIRLVDLDRVVVFQKYINLSHVDDLKRRLGPQPSAEEVFRFALPLEPQLPKVQMMQNSQNTFTFVSVSNDFRFLEAELVPSNIVSILRSTGRPVAVLGLAVGFGSNFMNVVHAENRLVLANGSHRAYALRALGIQKVPCLIQRVTRREELDLIAPGELAANAERYLKAPRPSMLRDYFDPALGKVVSVYRKNRVVRVQFVIEQTDMPAQ
jgi:hypothetical protein